MALGIQDGPGERSFSARPRSPSGRCSCPLPRMPPPQPRGLGDPLPPPFWRDAAPSCVSLT